MRPEPVFVLCMLVTLTASTFGQSTWYVDDNGPNDPGGGDTSVSDPAEDGSAEHPFDAIQEGINAAAVGDVVYVRPGSYAGTGNYALTFVGKDIIVRCEGGPDACSVMTAAGVNTFRFVSGETPAARLEGFTIFGFQTSSVYCNGSSPTISHCRIANNNTHGLWCENGAAPPIEDSTIQLNGYGVVGCAGPITDSIIRGNISAGLWGVPGPIERCQILSNSGIGVLPSEGARISESVIAGNGAIGADTGGIYALFGVLVERSVLTGNGPAAVRCQGTCTFRNSILHHNWGSVVHFRTATPPQADLVDFHNCTIFGNSTGAGQIIFANSLQRASLRNTIFWGNSGQRVSGTGILEAQFSDVQGGLAGPGNFDANPQIADPDGPDNNPQTLTDNDWRLLLNSPCMAGGDPDYVPSLDELDFYGGPRLAECVVDVGASERPEGFLMDCNGNTLPDACDIRDGSEFDCNMNRTPDSCEITDGTQVDCNANDILDSCERAAGARDCNNNLTLDVCEIRDGAPDCDTNGVIDSCEVASTTIDCNRNQRPDACDIAENPALDCDGNAKLDSCEVTSTAVDCNRNQRPDVCEIADNPALDCNNNVKLDSCEVTSTAVDCDRNQRPDSCDLTDNPDRDCDGNGKIDSCEVASTSVDCDRNQRPDACDVAENPERDCDDNGKIDLCETNNGQARDCNNNDRPDVCDIDSGIEPDCNVNRLIDWCEVRSNQAADCDDNLVPDSCQIAEQENWDCNENSIADICEPHENVIVFEDEFEGLVIDPKKWSAAANFDLYHGTLFLDTHGFPECCEAFIESQLISLRGLRAATLELDVETYDGAHTLWIELHTGEAWRPFSAIKVPASWCSLARSQLRYQVFLPAESLTDITRLRLRVTGELPFPQGWKIYRIRIVGRYDDADGSGVLDICEAGQPTFEDCNDNAILDASEFSRFHFSNRLDYSTGAEGIVAGDWDSDGDVDLVVGETNGAGPDTLLNNGSGTLTRLLEATNYSNRRLKAADFDGDGDLDVLTSGGVRIHFNRGGTHDNWGKFRPSTLSLLSAETGAVDAGDLDGDGDVDVVATQSVAWGDPGTCKSWLNDGASNFTLASTFNVGSTARSLELADLDRDGDLDAVVANQASFNLTVALNGGRNQAGQWAGFGSPMTIPTASRDPFHMIVSDLNQDGFPDLLVSDTVSDGFFWRLNDGIEAWDAWKGFGPEVRFELPGRIVHLHAADLDGDFLPDLVVADEDGPQLIILQNLGLSAYNEWLRFVEVGRLPTGDGQRGIATPDLNGDGLPDIVCANPYNSPDTITTYLQFPGVSTDCNRNHVPDDCDGTFAFSAACPAGQFFSRCPRDCNRNAVPDPCEVAAGKAHDCDGDGHLDECELAYRPYLDCDHNAILDTCELPAQYVFESPQLAPATSCGTHRIRPPSPPQAACDVSATVTLAGIGINSESFMRLMLNNQEVSRIPLTSCNMPEKATLLIPADVYNAALGLGLEFAFLGSASCPLVHSRSRDYLQLRIEYDVDSAIDCNRNQTLDSCDIATGHSLDVGLDGIPDECQRPGNMNFDGTNDLSDLRALLDCFQGPETNSCQTQCRVADANSDKLVSLNDVAAFFRAFGSGNP